MAFLNRDLGHLQRSINSMVGAMRQSLVEPDSMMGDIDLVLTPTTALLLGDRDDLSSSMPTMTMGAMHLDVHATPAHYLISCDLPGVDKSLIDIQADPRTRTLTIKAERKSEFVETEPQQQQQQSGAAQTKAQTQTQTQGAQGQVQKEQKQQQGQSVVKMETDQNKQVGAARPRVIREERFYGNIQRSIRLARDADLDHIEAKYENGVLRLQVPREQEKEEENRAKKITLQ